MKTPKPIFQLVVFFLVVGFRVYNAQGNALKLEEVRQEVMERNPSIQAAKARADARKYSAKIERSLPAPEFSYERWGLGGGKIAEESWYGIRQKIPFPSKLSRKAQSMEHEANAQGYHAQGTERELLSQAEKAYFDLFYYSRALPNVEENAILFRQFIRSGAAKYATSEIAQVDLVRAQTELTKLLNLKITLEQEKASIDLELKTLMNRVFDVPLGTPEAPTMRELPNVDALEHWALSNRPEVRAAEHHIEHLRANRAVAKLEYVPDFEVRYAYRTRPLLDNDSMVMVGIELPFFWLNRPRAVNRMAEAELKEAQANFSSLQLETRAAIHRAWTGADTARRSAQLIETTLLPQARQTQKIMVKAYATRQVTFLDLVDAERTRLDAELEWASQLRNFGQRIADLERLLGNSLSEVSYEK